VTFDSRSVNSIVTQDNPTPKRSPIFVFAKTLGACIFACLGQANVWSQTIEYDTMSSLIDRGSQAFAQGQYAQASELFRKLQSLYSDEPEWTQTRLSEKVLPIAGYAALKAGLYDRAIDSLQSFLDEESPAFSQETFAKYSIALAHMRQGNSQAALDAFAVFREGAVSVSQIGIALLQEARILIKEGDTEAALEKLDAIRESKAAARVRAQARLMATRQYLEKKDFPRLVTALAGESWDTETMPELALLAFLSIEAGDALLEAGLADDALVAYRLTPSKADLIEQQGIKLASLKRRFETRRGDVGMGGIMWTEFYEQLIRSATAQLSALQEAEDYSSALLLRRGRAALLANRPFESWLLFERVARDATEPFAEQARFHWILAARELGRPRQAIAIARTYLDQYPSSPNLDDTLYLIAQSMMDQNRLEDAVLALGELASNASDANLRASCLFQRGQCYLRMENRAAASQDFTQVVQIAPESPLSEKARLWNGIALFLDRAFEDALSEFASLAESATIPNLKGEALYRVACASYSLSRYDDSKIALQNFKKDFPHHERFHEATLLQGDCAFAGGFLEEAIAHYQAIPPDWPEIGQIAAIQTSDAYLEQGNASEALSAIQRRIRFANTSIDQCELRLVQSHILLETGDDAAAISTIDQCIETFGDDISAIGLFEALQLRHALIPYNLDTRYQTALDADNLVLASRLGLLQMLDLRDAKRPFQSKERALELANELPTDKLSPACLAYLGLELAQLDFPQGIELLERLLLEHPDSPYESLAFYGFAWNEAERSNPQIALGWLERIADTAVDSPIYIDSLALKGRLLSQLGEFSTAQLNLEKILSLRWASSAQKADALIELANLKSDQGEAKQAIAYYQRVFTLYPGIESAAAKGYLGSALRLQELSEYEKARETITEFLDRPEYRNAPEYEEGKSLKAALDSALAEQSDEGGQS